MMAILSKPVDQEKLCILSRRTILRGVPMSVPSIPIAVAAPLDIEYSARLLKGACEYARQHQRIRIVELPYRTDEPARLALPLPLPFEAAFIWATREAAWVEELLAAGIPVVSASGDWPTARIPCVSLDSVRFVEKAVEHLARLRPAILVLLQFRITGVPPMERRCRQFEQAAARLGIPCRCEELLRPGDKADDVLMWRAPLEAAPRRWLKALLQKLPKPAAVWCGVDYLGLRVCEVAAEMGIEVPGDLAVLGTGDLPAGAEAPLPLSSVPLPGEQIGFRALELLHGHLAHQRAIPPFTRVEPPPVVERQSTLGRGRGGPLERALAVIAARCCEGVTVREVAAAVGLSPQALHAQFLKHLGHAPGEEIGRARHGAARRLLKDPRLSIAEVALRCGFNQPSKFANFFRRRGGLSPRDWRKANP
jgi:LacI family transcriptional regulator